jgi:tetratricopeptide (TPR) repeat protein
VIFIIQTHFQQRTIFKLIGTDEAPKYVSAEEQNILATNNSVKTLCFYQRAYINFLFRSYDGTKENIEKSLACIGNTWANLLLAHAYHAFYAGLISFWLAREAREEQHWYQRGNQAKLALRSWAQTSPWTFENKWYLLEAEESFYIKDFDAAKAYYEKAVSSAKSHKVR